MYAGLRSQLKCPNEAESECHDTLKALNGGVGLGGRVGGARCRAGLAESLEPVLAVAPVGAVRRVDVLRGALVRHTVRQGTGLHHRVLAVGAGSHFARSVGANEHARVGDHYRGKKIVLADRVRSVLIFRNKSTFFVANFEQNNRKQS